MPSSSSHSLSFERRIHSNWSGGDLIFPNFIFQPEAVDDRRSNKLLQTNNRREKNKNVEDFYIELRKNEKMLFAHFIENEMCEVKSIWRTFSRTHCCRRMDAAAEPDGGQFVSHRLVRICAQSDAHHFRHRKPTVWTASANSLLVFVQAGRITGEHNRSKIRSMTGNTSSGKYVLNVSKSNGRRACVFDLNEERMRRKSG